MRKAIKHIKAWNIWRKRSLNRKIYKVLVLFGICHSPTFEMMEAYILETIERNEDGKYEI